MLNHYAAGIVVASHVGVNAQGFVLAAASHYVMDATPHFGYTVANHGVGLRSRMIKRLVPIDVVLTMLSVLYLSTAGVSAGVLIFGLVAFLPDVAWVYRFVVKEKMGKLAPGPMGPLNRFHAWIQWFERPWAWAIEAVVAVALYSYIATEVI